MTRYRFVALTVIVALSGCSLFRSLDETMDAGSDVRGEIGFSGDASDLLGGAGAPDTSDVGNDFYDRRVGDGLVMLYTFENATAPFADQSGVSPPLDLDARVGATPLADRNGLHLTGIQSLISPEPPTKFYDAATAADAFSVELWIRPDSANQDGPARIVTLSQDGSNANLMIGEGGSSSEGGANGRLAVRMRHNEPTVDPGDPAVGQPTWFPTPIATVETQYVVTYAFGRLDLYVDGAHSGQTFDRTADFPGWDPSYLLAIGDEVGDPRPWAGEVYLVALYSKALDEAEVKQNFDVGSRVAP